MSTVKHYSQVHMHGQITGRPEIWFRDTKYVYIKMDTNESPKIIYSDILINYDEIRMSLRLKRWLKLYLAPYWEFLFREIATKTPNIFTS